MNDRDILADLRAWRDEFAKSHGYDLAAMGATLREMDKSATAPLVRGEPRPPAVVLPPAASAPNPTLPQIVETAVSGSA